MALPQIAKKSLNLQATSQHSSAQGGSVFLLSSDSFSYTGQVTDSLGIPSIRTWAITNTDLFQQVICKRHALFQEQSK